MTKTVEELRAAAVKADEKAADAGKEAWEAWRAKAKADMAKVRELKESTNDMPPQKTK